MKELRGRISWKEEREGGLVGRGGVCGDHLQYVCHFCISVELQLISKQYNYDNQPECGVLMDVLEHLMEMVMVVVEVFIGVFRQ